MRILHVIGELRTGGAEHTLERLVSASSSNGTEHLIAPLRASGSSTPSLADLAASVSRFNPSLIHGWMYHGSLAALAVSRIGRSPKPVVWGMRQSLGALDCEKLTLRLLVAACARMSNRVDMVVYNSERGRADHEARGYSARSVLIPNGFDTRRFRHDAQARERLRGRLHLSPSEILVGSLGRFHPVKDHVTFVAAAERAAASDPRLRFLIAGPDDGGLERVERRWAASRLGDRLTILEGAHDPVEVLSALDVFALTSRAEAFPNTLGEAMSCELPCVTTRAGDAEEMLGGLGPVVAPGDDAAIADAWLSIVNLPIDERKRLGRLGRERVIGRYSMETMVELYSALYRSLAP